MKDISTKYDKAIFKYFAKQSRKIMKKYPKWNVAFSFARGRIVKYCKVGFEHHYQNICRTVDFSIDIRENWKNPIRQSFKRINEYLSRCE